MRERYPRFARDRRTLGKEVAVYEENVRRGAFSIEQLVDRVLKPLIDIDSFFQGEKSMTKLAGELLRWVSYAGCTLGHEASFGDMETELRLLYSSPIWLQREISPRVLLTTYKRGESQQLMALVNDRLEQSCDAIMALGRAKATMSSVSHAPSLWLYEKKGQVACDYEILNTGYYLNSSLARLLEQKQGTS